MATGALATQEAQLKTEEGLEKEHKLSVCSLAPICLPLEMNSYKLLSVTAKVWSQVLEYYTTEQSNVRQMHSTALKLDAFKKSFQMDASSAKLCSGLWDRPLKT